MQRHDALKVVRWTYRINAALAGERVGPIRCDLNLENRCDNSCYFCEPAAFRAGTMRDRKHTLDTGIAINCLDDLKELDCQTVNFSGGGEPTLHPDFSMIHNHARDLGFTTWVVTHGGHMHKHWDSIIRACHVRISLDASDEEERQYMHNSKDFHTVRANIASICGHGPEVGIGYILTDKNSSLSSLYSICEWASKVGVNFIHFRPISEDTDKPTLTRDMAELYSDVESMRSTFPALDIWNIGKRHKDVFLQRSFNRCYASYFLSVISANGEVCACCDERTKVFGNLYDKSFKEIWLGDEHRKAADAIVPQFCPRCLMCSINKSVQDNVVNNKSFVELL